jgi:hypothetical protein
MAATIMDYIRINTPLVMAGLMLYLIVMTDLIRVSRSHELKRELEKVKENWLAIWAKNEALTAKALDRDFPTEEAPAKDPTLVLLFNE